MSYVRSVDHFDPKAFGKVSILFGGSSAEREISLTSGQRIYASLTRQGVECQLIDTSENVVQQLITSAPDIAFIALHGDKGEDGTIQGVLDCMGIPYPGSGVLSSALAMDKYRCKLLWQSLGLPTPEFALAINSEDLEYCEVLLPAFVKPSLGGSSVGISKIDRRQDLESACELAGKYNGSVLVEAFIEGYEFTVGILNDQPLPGIRIQAAGDFYDYEAKYLSDKTDYHIPCGLSPVQEQEMQAIALTAFEALGCRGWGRVDLMQDKQGRFWLLEVNTIPGMSDHSLLPMAANQAGLSFDDLVIEVLKLVRLN